MDYNELINDTIDFIIKNYIIVLSIVAFIIIVIIGYFADKRRSRNKKSEEVIPAVKEEQVQSSNLPMVEEISVPALEPAIDIVPEPEPDYETSYNDFKSIEVPYTFEKFNEDKVDINTMSGTTADISPEIDKIFQDFNFDEEETIKDTNKEIDIVEKAEEIPVEEPVQIDDIVNKIDEVEDKLVDNDMEYDDIKPDKSIFDEIKPYSNDQDNINNLF